MTGVNFANKVDDIQDEANQAVVDTGKFKDDNKDEER